jgi:hypothetical protein
MVLNIGYSANMPVRITQEFDTDPSVARRLVEAFGGRAYVSLLAG